MNAKVLMIAVVGLMVSALLVGCSNGAVTNTPLPTMASGNTPIPTAGEISLTPPVGSAETANLYAIVSVGGQPAQAYEADIFIFSKDQLVAKGQTNKGVYVAQLNSGIYDVVMAYKGLPLFGQIQRSVSVDQDKMNVVTFELPSEGTLNTTVVMKNGKTAFRTSYVTIVSGDQKIVADSSSSSVILRTGLTYSLTVKYGDPKSPNQVFNDKVSVASHEPTDEVFTLPYDEIKLKMNVTSGSSTAFGCNLLITDTDSGDIVNEASSAYFDDSFIVLEAGKTYKVKVTYKGNTQEKTIKAIAGDQPELNFTYP